MQVRVFIDRSVIEVFVNSRSVLTARAYPTLAGSTGVYTWAAGTAAPIERFQAWGLAA